MKKRTLQTLRDLAEIYGMLQACQVKLKRIPGRYRDLYISVPSSCEEGLQRASYGLQDFACRIVELEKLLPHVADLSRYRTIKNSTIKP